MNFELVGADRLDRRAVELSVLGVVDLTFPGIGAGLLLHLDQDRHAQGRPALLCDVRIVLVLAARRHFPGNDAPHVAATLGDANIGHTIGYFPVTGGIGSKRSIKTCG